MKAPEHRVRPTIDPKLVRYSAPFFYNPNYDAIVRPLALACSLNSVVDPAGVLLPAAGNTRVSNYAPIRWGDYRNMRFQGDFKDVGEEVQIEHFTAAAT
mgnify:CR=1 FL=1